MKIRVFIDGSAGTTGLRIRTRLSGRDDIELIVLDESVRKDENARRDAINSSDITFLCLPDAAATEAVAMVTDSDTVIIDTSTAHRTSEGWVYGFPELSGQREKIRSAHRIANPGCHASGFISLVRPLAENGIIKSGVHLSCTSVTGYSGGGKKMIAQYEEEGRDILLDAPRMYGLSQNHKHLPEMAKVCGIENDPVFCPVVAPYYAGMEVVVPLFSCDINGSVNDIRDIYSGYYREGLVRYCDNAGEDGFMSAGLLEGRDDMQITVCGNDDRILLVSRFDNLGKGASGSAIQNMNIVMGIDEKTGLNTGE